MSRRIKKEQVQVEDYLIFNTTDTQGNMVEYRLKNPETVYSYSPPRSRSKN